MFFFLLCFKMTRLGFQFQFKSLSVPTEQVDSCALNPQRRIWAQRKCGLLKSSEFAQCHGEVSVDTFYKRCIFDTCSCDMGGDCECLCTALSAYAYACSMKGVFIKWRNEDLCRELNFFSWCYHLIEQN